LQQKSQATRAGQKLDSCDQSKGLSQKREPILRQDARQNKDLEEDDVSKKDILL